MQVIGQRLRHVHPDAGRIARGVRHFKRRIIQFHPNDERRGGLRPARGQRPRAQAKRGEGKKK